MFQPKKTRILIRKSSLKSTRDFTWLTNFQVQILGDARSLRLIAWIFENLEFKTNPTFPIFIDFSFFSVLTSEVKVCRVDIFDRELSSVILTVNGQMSKKWHKRHHIRGGVIRATVNYKLFFRFSEGQIFPQKMTLLTQNSDISPTNSTLKCFIKNKHRLYKPTIF